MQEGQLGSPSGRCTHRTAVSKVNNSVYELSVTRVRAPLNSSHVPWRRRPNRTISQTHMLRPAEVRPVQEGQLGSPSGRCTHRTAVSKVNNSVYELSVTRVRAPLNSSHVPWRHRLNRTISQTHMLRPAEVRPVQEGQLGSPSGRCTHRTAVSKVNNSVYELSVTRVRAPLNSSHVPWRRRLNRTISQTHMLRPAEVRPVQEGQQGSPSGRCTHRTAVSKVNNSVYELSVTRVRAPLNSSHVPWPRKLNRTILQRRVL